MDTLTIQQPMQTVSLTLPKCDVAFLKTLIKKMGWSMLKKKDVTPDIQKMMDRSRQEYKDGKVLSFQNASDAQQWLNTL